MVIEHYKKWGATDEDHAAHAHRNPQRKEQTIPAPENWETSTGRNWATWRLQPLARWWRKRQERRFDDLNKIMNYIYFYSKNLKFNYKISL